LITPLRNAEASPTRSRAFSMIPRCGRGSPTRLHRVRDMSWARTAASLAVHDRALNRKHAFAHA
jgi:hypothetical protein